MKKKVYRGGEAVKQKQPHRDGHEKTQLVSMVLSDGRIRRRHRVVSQEALIKLNDVLQKIKFFFLVLKMPASLFKMPHVCHFLPRICLVTSSFGLHADTQEFDA